MAYYAKAAAAQREQVIDRARQATRAREQEQYAAERARTEAWSNASLLERMSMSPGQLKLQLLSGGSAGDGAGVPHRQTQPGGIR